MFAGIALFVGSLTPLAAQADVFGAVLPISRAVQVNTTATAFATIINAGSTTATNCKLTMPSTVPGTFGFQTTDPLTNATTGTPNTAVSIAAGGSQTYVFSIKPTATFTQTDIPIGMSCDGGLSVASITGVNTFLLTSSTNPTPDVVALSATISNDGISRTPGTNASTAFSVATVNVGAAGTVTASVDTGSATLNASFSICQTNSQAQCLATPAATVNATFAANQTGTFSIFFTSLGTVIPLDPAQFRSFVRFKIAGNSVGATSVAVQTQVALAQGGGTLQLGNVAIGASDGAVINTNFSATMITTLPAPLPAGVSATGVGYSIGATNPAGAPDGGLNAPVNLTVPYSGLGISNPMSLGVLHYDSTLGEYLPVTIQNLDATNQTVTFDSRQFSSFILVILNAALPGTAAAPGFDPTTVSGYTIVNTGTAYLSPGGNCLGMSASTIYWHRFVSAPLRNYSTANAPASTQDLMAMLAHIAQSQYWQNLYGTTAYGLAGQRAHPDWTSFWLRAYLSIFKVPMVLVVGNATNGATAHAIVAYGYDANNIFLYDPNVPNQRGLLPYSVNGFGSYTGGGYTWTLFSYIAFPSFGGHNDFATLKTLADGAFASGSGITITAPTAGSTVSTFSTALTGSLSSSLNANTAAYWKNGLPSFTPLALSGGAFSTNIDVASGGNVLAVIAGIPATSGTFSNVLSNGAVKVVRFNGPSPNRFRATLGWDQNGTDQDLYVTEPGGATAWYSNRGSGTGLQQDVDNTSGYGPENMTMLQSTTPQSGNYTVRVHYYSDHGTHLGGSGYLSVVLNERQTNQIGPYSRRWSISTSNPSNSSPGTACASCTGPDWFQGYSANIVGGTVTPLP
jgi:hypothetical protein